MDDTAYCMSPSDAKAVHDTVFRLRQLELTNELLQQEIDQMDKEHLELMLSLNDKELQLNSLQQLLQHHGIHINGKYEYIPISNIRNL